MPDGFDVGFGVGYSDDAGEGEEEECLVVGGC